MAMSILPDPRVLHGYHELTNDDLRTVVAAGAPGFGTVPPTARSPVPMSMLNEPGSAMDLPLNSLHALWCQRFGDAWVTEEKLTRDAFWAAASERLFSASLAERVYAYGPNSGAMHAYRIRRVDADS